MAQQHPIFDMIAQHAQGMAAKRNALASMINMTLADMERESQAFYRQLAELAKKETEPQPEANGKPKKKQKA